MEQNPFTLMFGKEPEQLVPRFPQTDEICRTFLSERPAQQIYMLTGVRGAGKTVMMTEISRRIRAEERWTVVELNPAKDLLLGLAAKLYNEKSLAEIFENAKINLSFFGIGLEVSKAKPVTDIEVALSRMLEGLAKRGKRVLITIDEAVDTERMRVFASAFQIFVRQDLPLFLLMTGLYENIDALQNDKILTFLYRAPKMQLKPLNLGSIAALYRKVFQLNEEEARKMAKLTRGYPFAFQVLGYYTWENNGDYGAAIDRYRQYLDEYVYDKIWSELSRGDRRAVFGMAESKTGKIAEIRETLGMKPNEFSPYRDRLIKKGLINGDERGYVRFVLPFFENYVIDHYFDEAE